MLATDESLAEISLLCGLAGHSHLAISLGAILALRQAYGGDTIV